MAAAPNADVARVWAVSNAMSPDPVIVDVDASVADALNLMLFSSFRHLPVSDTGALVGVVSMRDLASILSRD